MQLFELAAPDKNEVCPICFKGRCSLFNKLRDLAFDPAERSDFIRRFHKKVCGRCKRRKCTNFLVKRDGDFKVVSCDLYPAKKIAKHKHLPLWWREAK